MTPLILPHASGQIEIIIDDKVPFGWFEWVENSRVVRMPAAGVWVLYRELNPWLTACI